MSEQKQVFRRGYDTVNFTINSENIEEFEVMENRRNIGDAHVSKIHGAILSGKNPIGVIIVNRKNKRYRIIDGNHRIEAIKRFYSYRQLNKQAKFECVLRVYDNLSDEEEREVYSDEAKRKNESYEDRLNLHKDSIPLWNRFKDKTLEFPCKVSIYQHKESLRLRTIINAFYTVKSSSTKGYVPSNINKDNIVDFAKSLSDVDYCFLRDFLIFFEKIFGKVERSNPYTKTQFFLPLFDIYHKNIKLKKQANFEEKFKRIVGRSDILAFTNTAGREWKMKIRELMLGYLNWGLTKNKFI